MSGKIHNKIARSQQDLFENDPLSASNCQKAHGIMFCDGASSGNPGKSGIGVVIDIYDDDLQYEGSKKAYRISEYIGIATNNVAEYSAFIKGLEKARSLGIKKINAFLDSELLVRQINGVYRVKNKNLMPLWVQAMNLLKEFDTYKVTHIPREKNSEADFLAREAVKRKRGE